MTIQLGRPVKLFLGNLYRYGFTVTVTAGRLHVAPPADNPALLTEPVKAEIIKRRQLIIDLFTPAPPPELEPFFFRLLRVDEFTEAAHVADRLGVYLDACPCDGGWLVFVSKIKRPPKVKSEKHSKSDVGGPLGAALWHKWERV